MRLTQDGARSGWLETTITVKQILIGIQDLLDSPNPADPTQTEGFHLFIQLEAEECPDIAKSSMSQKFIGFNSVFVTAEGSKNETGLCLTNSKDCNFMEWYFEVLRNGEMIEDYDVSGCYTLRPWAMGIWERMQEFFNLEIEKMDVEPCNFPLFVSNDALQKHKDHIERFASEVVWVTKSGDSGLEVPIAIRPTSETVMYPSFSKRIRGHRDLPLKLNQWVNVVRWELSDPIPFIRTREFSWQEGHTAFATKVEADTEVLEILELYRRVYEEYLAVPVLKGEKSEMEKFAGGLYTTTVAAFIPHAGRGVHGATSHSLGQNFAEVFDIKFEDENGEKAKVWQNSWAYSTRTIGVMVMCHSDDKGLVLPPKVSEIQVILVPVPYKDDVKEITDACYAAVKSLCDSGIRAEADLREDYSPGWKYRHWEMKGVPLRIKIGPKNIANNKVRAVRRDNGEKVCIAMADLVDTVKDMLDTIQQSMFDVAKQKRDASVVVTKTWDEFIEALGQKKLILAPWCDEEEVEKEVKTKTKGETGSAKTLCSPFDQPELPEGMHVNLTNKDEGKQLSRLIWQTVRVGPPDGQVHVGYGRLSRARDAAGPSTINLTLKTKDLLFNPNPAHLLSFLLEAKKMPATKSTVAKSSKGRKKETGLRLRCSKDVNFGEWYSKVLINGEMIGYYDVSGCYILWPWAMGIWNRMKKFFDPEIKKMNVKPCRFPLFVSNDALQKEKDHIEGFAPEVAWVTRSGESNLEAPIAIRPTSETVMYPTFSKWIRRRSDLPLKLNQWVNVVRWEFSNPTPFIRSREFLWQEGHTAFATKDEADAEVLEILELYRRLYEEYLAVPVVKGKKSEMEKFAGGLYTTSVEAFIPNTGRGVQGATSHCLGQNFAKMFDISFEEKGEKAMVWQNSWAFSTRTIGVMAMVHGDDKGLVLPPKVSKVQVIVVHVPYKDDVKKIINACSACVKTLCDSGILAESDLRENYSPGWKFSHWESKGVPLRIEIGPNDIAKNQVCAVRRDNGAKVNIPMTELVGRVKDMLDTIQQSMFDVAKQKRDASVVVTKTWDEFIEALGQKKLILAPWCDEEEVEKEVKTKTKGETGSAKTLCSPFDQPELPEGTICFASGKPAKIWTYWGRSY
ncbi:hypothetical protein SSX86_001506 [Deinandra increscens subsp. villosa]|uniref:Proline--tRNA ligase n=1 Tax=Deinandra increscens subsp. villosa TaxID=3103831 RepID=A0AAP0DV35_9ASTR